MSNTYERLTKAAMNSIDPAHCDTDAYVVIVDDCSIRIITPAIGSGCPRQELILPSIHRNVLSVAEQLKFAVGELNRRNATPNWEDEP